MSVETSSAAEKPKNFELAPDNAGKLEQWTNEYEKPSKDPLPIDSEVVDRWLTTILAERLLVIRGVDTAVLHAAEHAIAARFLERPGSKPAACRSAMLRRSAPAKYRAKSSPSDEPVCTIDTLSENWPDTGKGPMLVTAAAYNAQLAEPLLASLPEDRSGLSWLCNRLGRNDRYLVVLTTPSAFPLQKFQQSVMDSFKGEADFIRPYLGSVDLDGSLENKLRRQYDADLWTRSGKNVALDERFLQEFLIFLDNGLIKWNIEALEELSKSGDKDAYERQRQEKINKSFERKHGWPEPDQFFDQVLLFAAAFFSKVPIEDYSRIVSRLVGKNNRRTAVPVRTLARQDRETIVSEYQDVPLTHSWWTMRNSLVNQWGLKVMKSEGRYCVTAPDAPDINRAFANRYPFTYMELWQRMLDGGFLFDDSADVAMAFESLMVSRVSEDPARFGQSFLIDVLASGQAIGFPSEEELDLAQRFERLKEKGQLGFVLERTASLMRAILDHDPRDVVASSIEQFIEWGVPHIALQFLRGVSKLPIARRLKLLDRVLHQSEEPQEYWEDACTLLKVWLTATADGLETMKWILSFVTPIGTEPSDQSIAVAGAAMDVASSWFEGPGPERHKLTEFLSSEPVQGLSLLVKWLFHPALERARNQEPVVAFFGLWLLAAQARSSSIEEKSKLINLQIDLYSRFRNALPRLAVTGTKPIEIDDPPVVREYQATVIAEWMAALPDVEPQDGAASRKLLMEILAKEASEDLRRQLFVFWRAMDEASAGKMTVIPGDPDAALLRKIIPTLQQGRRIFRQLMSDWVFPSKIADAAASS